MFLFLLIDEFLDAHGVYVLKFFLIDVLHWVPFILQEVDKVNYFLFSKFKILYFILKGAARIIKLSILRLQLYQLVLKRVTVFGAVLWFTRHIGETQTDIAIVIVLDGAIEKAWLVITCLLVQWCCLDAHTLHQYFGRCNITGFDLDNLLFQLFILFLHLCKLLLELIYFVVLCSIMILYILIVIVWRCCYSGGLCLKAFNIGMISRLYL